MGENESKPIILVDDAPPPENIDVLSGILQDDYKIKAALNGERALKIASGENQPDLILLDVMMPDMDGYDVCRRLKERAYTRKIPVIFVTTLDEVIESSEDLRSGVSITSSSRSVHFW